MTTLRFLSKTGYFVLSLSLILCGTTAVYAKPTQMPLSVSFATEPNIMILLDTSISMGNIPAEESTSKLAAAKEAIVKAMAGIDNTRFCLSIFNNDPTRHGSNITPVMQCTSDDNSLEDLIATIQDPAILFAMPDSGRPLAATFYDITRYFRGKGAYFGPWSAYPAQAIDYRCQDNTVIVISDGEPEEDWPAPVSGSLINILNDPITVPISTPLEDFPKTLPELTQSATLIDFVPTAANDHANGRPDDLAQQSFNDASFPNQTIETHAISLLGNFPILEEAAAQGNGLAHRPLLRSKVYSKIEHIIAGASINPEVSGANASQSAAVTEGNQSNIFITQFDSTDWSGTLINLEQIESPDGAGDFDPTQAWNAADLLSARSASSRRIFTQRPDNGQAVSFEFDQLSSDQTAFLDANIVNYIRGDHSNEIGAGGGEIYRARSNVLGDIVHSSATYVKNFNFGYPEPDYIDFLTGTGSDEVGNRQAVVYVGSNDGMLHAFNAETGEEMFAFIPNTVIEGLSNLTSPNYISNHQYYVDGEMTVVDARLDDDWSTVLASPLGAGFKGLFLLNVTDPEDNENNAFFEWEKTEQSDDYSNMGYILNSPKIGRVLIPEAGGGFHERWLLFVGNGVHSEDQNDVFQGSGSPIIGKASVFIIDLESGNVIKEIVLDDARDEDGLPKYDSLSSGNGVTSVTAVDQNANSYVDRLYAADLKGNLWRINYEFNADDVDGDEDDEDQDDDYIRNHFKVAFEIEDKPAPIFQATGPVRVSPDDTNPSGSAAQAITSEITVTGPPVASNESTGELLFFGTGQYFDTHHIQDQSNLKVQSMYAIWDQGGWDQREDAIDKEVDLSEQTITQESGAEERFFDEVISYDNNILGWYIDLPDYGERMISQPVSLFDNISFDSLSPISAQGATGFDPCIEGATAWSMIARQDTATALLSLANSTPEAPVGGVKQSENVIKGSIFVERPDGQLVSPTINASSLNAIIVGSGTQIQKTYQRGAWKRIQF